MLRKLWTWIKGEHGSYRSMLLMFGQEWDLSVICVPVGADISPHKDELIDRDHHRVVMILWKADKGGVFKAPLKKWSRFNGRLFRFRPDNIQHSVSVVSEGVLWYLSLGWYHLKTKRTLDA